MTLNDLQNAICRCKTPLALTLAPEIDRVEEKIRKNFREMFGEGPMADTEALRYHGTAALDRAEGKLAAVVIEAGKYFPYGMMGVDVLYNLVSAAKAKGFYVILDCGAVDARPWLPTGADGYTVSPYGGESACRLGEEKTAFALVRTANAGGDLQNLRSGDRPLYAAAAEQMARYGAALVVETGYSLDIKELRRRCEKAFLLLKNCDGENALPAFDDYGHGALVADDTLQYGTDADEAIKSFHQWVNVL